MQLIISHMYDAMPLSQVGDSSLQVGAAVSLSNLIGLFHDNQSKSASFEQLTNHLSMIANVPVRNIATWAGNLMLTHDHDNFPSDVFTMMAGVGAKVTIGKSYSHHINHSRNCSCQFLVHGVIIVRYSTSIIVLLFTSFLGFPCIFY